MNTLFSEFCNFLLNKLFNDFSSEYLTKSIMDIIIFIEHSTLQKFILTE